MVRSGSFDPRTMALPSVSLNFLRHSSPASHATEWPTDTTADQPRMCRTAPPRSPKSQAAIEKCIAALAECRSVLAQSATDATGQAQSYSPHAAGIARAFLSSPAYIPRAGDAPDAAVGAASEEDILRWIEDTTGSCEPPAYPPSAPWPDAFAKSPPTLEATQGQIDGFFSQIPCKCHQNRVASVGD